MGTEFLMIVLLWCNNASTVDWNQTVKCRKDKITCIRTLKNGFTTDDVIDKCLMTVQK